MMVDTETIHPVVSVISAPEAVGDQRVMPDSALLTFGNRVWVPEQGLDEQAGGAKYCAFNRQMPSASFFLSFSSARIV